MKKTATALIATLIAFAPTAAFADSSSSSDQATPGLERQLNSADAQQEKSTQAAPENLAALKAKAAESIAKRQRDLASWATTLATATPDCGQNAAAAARITGTQASLTTLGASIAAATTLDAAKPLYGQIFTHNRVYLVVAPAVHTAIACDKQWARAAKQTATIAELQAKIAAAKAKGVDTTAAEALLAQVPAPIELGKTTSAAGAASLAGLAPDQGNEAAKAANAVKVAAAKEQIRQADAQFDKAADLLRQTAKALGADVKDDKKADHEAEKAKREAERKAAQEKRDAEKAKRQAEQEQRKADRKAGKSGKSGS